MRKAMANVHGFAFHKQPNSSLTMSRCGQIFFTQPSLCVPIATSNPAACLLPTSSNHGSRRGALRLYASSKEQSCQVRKKRQRLDEMCVQRFPQYSRTMIQSWILRGKVLVDGQVAGKAGMSVSDKASIEITAEVPKYVCRAGYKLEGALEQLNIDVAGKVALDSGLSTGGFTDCLLQHGASFVYGVDVGYGQVAEKIRTDKRVSVIDRTNLRYLSGLPQKVDLVTLDLSFISILLASNGDPGVGRSTTWRTLIKEDQVRTRTTFSSLASTRMAFFGQASSGITSSNPAFQGEVMPAVVSVMKQESELITLIKPQFEARRSQVGGGGIVRDLGVHKEVLEKIIKGVEVFGFTTKGWIESPIKGAEGNVEFLAHFQRNEEKAS
ncbi:uncharacterized protein LOC131064983 isoform X2 [Cryptomeria japonica]|uniref:uncharacterized protein LOC131064983 isoform X2 n=1 Tax=Cryptomeria japonica TaxID=3369 RepID=UPI0027DA2C23|nr:uncharacterized protein LOC131064983 isoform X2 [Cryptomeria japonica]